MELNKSKQAMFLFGISLTGGKGRLYSGESNKYISKDESGLIIKGSNLFIDGTEVVVNEETLAANKLAEQVFEYTEEQKMYLLAGLIAGMYQPEKRPVRWAYLTFIVDEETLIKEDEDEKIYEIDPNEISKKQTLLESSNGSSVNITDIYKSAVEVVPDENGFIKLEPGKKYVTVSTGGKGVKVPSKAKEEDEEEIKIPEPEPDPDPDPDDEDDDDDEYKKIITDYVDDDGNEMTKIEIPLGHNKIVIYFLQSDKSEDGSWYKAGANITIEAVPGAGWSFVQWTIDETLVVTEKKYSFVVNYDSVYRARFRQRGVSALDGYEVISSNDPANPDYEPTGSYTIIVRVDPLYPNGTVGGSGTYAEGTVVAIVAVPNNGYKTQWYLNNSLIGSDNTLQVIADADKEYIARFIAMKVIPYIEAGLTDSFDLLLNKTTEYSSTIRHWENLMMDQDTYETNEYGYVMNGLTDSFDSIGKSVDSPDEWINEG